MKVHPRHWSPFLWILCLLLVSGSLYATVFGCDSGKPLINSAGKEIGKVTFYEVPGGVMFQVEASNVSTGWHGLHVHAVGDCTTPDFKSAGGHFNPGNRQHGLRNPQGHHVGDIPNVYVGEDGVLKVEAVVEGASVSGENPLKDADGFALVLHDKADDYRTDPAGDAGGRIACAAFGKKAK